MARKSVAPRLRASSLVSESEDEVSTMMDAEFVRAWRLYLAGSIAAFRVGELQLYQVVFAHNRNNEIPWSREHLYRSKPSRVTAETEIA